MKKNKKITLSVGLFIVIIALLLVLLVVLPDSGGLGTATEGEDFESTVEIAAERAPDAVEEALPDPTINTQSEKDIFLIIDDVGNNLAHLERFLRLPVAVTFAVMPARPYTAESARRIRDRGFDMILHQPMEPEGGQDPGNGAIVTGMTVEEIHGVLEQNLVGLQHLQGINNHMGSKATADEATMKAVMAFLDRRKMFFLDSVTTDRSVAADAASEWNVPFARRNSLFLDNDDEKSAVLKAFASGIDVASKDGEVVMIGHIKTASLAVIIEEGYKYLQEQGFVFRGMSEYFIPRRK